MVEGEITGFVSYKVDAITIIYTGRIVDDQGNYLSGVTEADDVNSFDEIMYENLLSAIMFGLEFGGKFTVNKYLAFDLTFTYI